MLDNINHFKNLNISNKHETGEMLKLRVFAFCTTDKDKHLWLMTKHISLWSMNAQADEIKRLHETLTSGNVSTGQRGVNLKFCEIHGIPDVKRSQHFHPHSCTCKLDMFVHGMFMGRDVVDYPEFEKIWNGAIDPQVHATC